jgi:hypothetical protein
VVLAWVVCALGFGTGALGCVFMASNARPTSGATLAKRVRYPLGKWARLVEDAATDTLATVRRLASGITPSEVADLQAALRNAGERFDALRESMPARVAGTAEFASMLDIAAAGARAEATRLAGASVIRSDRRTFLAALRMLREASAHVDVAASVRVAIQPAATGDIAPSFMG